MVQPALLVLVRAGSVFPCHLSGSECASYNLTGHLTVLDVITCRKSTFFWAGTVAYTLLVSNSLGRKSREDRCKNCLLRGSGSPEKKRKERLQITRGVASAVLPVLTVAVWKPQRLSIAAFFFCLFTPECQAVSPHKKPGLIPFNRFRECLF